jgi:hypothetical protein
LATLHEAVCARNGWKRILERCRPPQRRRVKPGESTQVRGPGSFLSAQAENRAASGPMGPDQTSDSPLGSPGIGPGIGSPAAPLGSALSRAPWIVVVRRLRQPVLGFPQVCFVVDRSLTNGGRLMVMARLID